MKSKNTVEQVIKLEQETVGGTNFLLHVQMMVEAGSEFYLRDVASLVANSDFESNLKKIEAKYVQISKLNFREMKALFNYFYSRTKQERNRAQEEMMSIQDEITELINQKII